MTTPDFGASHSLNALYDAVPETSLAAYRGRRIVIPAPSYQFLTKTGEIDHARREAALGNLEARGAVPTLMSGALTQDAATRGLTKCARQTFKRRLPGIRPKPIW